MSTKLIKDPTPREIDLHCSVVLAKAIKKAAELYENSYDKVASDLATEQARKAALGYATASEYVDYLKFYRKSLLEACQEANAALAPFVYLMLRNSWNGSIEQSIAILIDTGAGYEEPLSPLSEKAIRSILSGK